MFGLENMSAVKIEAVCPLCNHRNLITAYSPCSSYDIKNEYMIAECSNCQVAHTTPMPTAKTLENIYSSSYGYEAHSLIVKEKQAKAKQIINFIGDKKRILDYGCSYGVLLDQAKMSGHLTYGIEINEELAEKQRLKGHAIFQQIEDTGNNKFDVIVFNHSLEHILTLKDEFKKVVDRLYSNGIVIVLAPNYNSFWRRIFKMSWGWYQQPIHIWHFNINSLKIFFERNGLQLKYKVFLPGDSLLVLLTFRNFFSSKAADTGQLSLLSKVIIYCFSAVWQRVGKAFSKDEIFIIFNK